MDGFEWEQLSPRVGVMTDCKQRNGWFQLVYLGFTNQALANKFIRWLAKTAPAKRVELRSGSRFAGIVTGLGHMRRGQNASRGGF